MNRFDGDIFSNLACVYFAGPSGSGKTYMAKKLVELYPTEFHRPLQITTRDKRVNEEEGVDYNFINEQQYQEMLMGEELCCDTSIVIERKEPESIINYYGTPRKNLSRDKINIIVVDKGGYETRIRTKNELLFGFDYVLLEEDKKNRMIGRENRDQRENFELLKAEFPPVRIFMNSTKNFIKPETVREIIYTCFMERCNYEPCFANLQKKKE